MTTYHLLNGDCLADQLKQTNINQDFIVCRECLIVGPVAADTLDAFWNVRAQFITTTYQESTEKYFDKTVHELNKLNNLPEHSEICLWFENDLFCQVNMWLVLSLLSKYPTFKVFRVFPVITNKADRWKGFAESTPETLEQAYHSKILFSNDDINLGKKLWSAYQNNDLDKLTTLAKTPSYCFEYLEAVCQAHSDRFPLDQSLGRPEKVVQEILDTQSRDFSIVFTEFVKREGIYGFGDSQIKSMYDRLIQ
jgi:hypothetical protein